MLYWTTIDQYFKLKFDYRKTFEAIIFLKRDQHLSIERHTYEAKILVQKLNFSIERPKIESKIWL